MNRLFFYLLLLMSVLLTSCITFVEKDLDIKPKLVLHCYLIPQMDTTMLTLTNSVPLFGSNPKNIETVTNAIVEISEDNYRWVRMEYDSVYKNYFIPQVQFPITEGKTYYIRASAPGYETVSASCIVPYFRETNFEVVVEAHTNCVHHGEPYPESHYHYYLKWKDYAGEENYYIFYRNFIWIWDWNDWDIDTSIIWEILWDEKGKPCLFSDHGQDGQNMSSLVTTYYLDDEISEITMVQTDVHSYLYQRSIEDYNGDLGFFIIEPVKIYSNIKNGYGVFGAFGMRTYAIEQPEKSHKVDKLLVR